MNKDFYTCTMSENVLEALPALFLLCSNYKVDDHRRRFLQKKRKGDSLVEQWDNLLSEEPFLPWSRHSPYFYDLLSRAAHNVLQTLWMLREYYEHYCYLLWKQSLIIAVLSFIFLSFSLFFSLWTFSLFFSHYFFSL